MINLKTGVMLSIVVLVTMIACNTSPLPDNKTTPVDSAQIKAYNDSVEVCARPQQYPNKDKPMALMMRQMADHAQVMKELVLKGETVTGKQFPFIRFHLVEPTDPDVLVPQFYENARLFQEAHKALINAKPEQQKEMYNLYINKCIGCHENFCSGPLKRIRKLIVE